MIEFDITLTPKDMYRFLMYQLYTGLQGWLFLITSILLFVTAFVTLGDVPQQKTAGYLVFAFIFLVFQPISMKQRAKHAVTASPVLSRPLHYAVGENGFLVTQDGESAELLWEQIYKMVATKHNVLVYSGRINAYVIPREQLGSNYGPLAELANAKLEKYRVKMKK